MKRAKHVRNRRLARRPVCESLERRELLSVDLVGTDLRVIGTDAGDSRGSGSSRDWCGQS